MKFEVLHTALPRPTYSWSADSWFHGFVSEKLWLGMICDGVSSGRYAAEASRDAVSLISQRLSGFTAIPSDIHEIIQEVSTRIEARWKGDGLTTLAMILVHKDTLNYLMVNVGDSSVHISRNLEVFRKISRDDSIFISSGRRVLTKALGMNPVVEYIQTGTLLPNDRIVLVSDGVCDRFFKRMRHVSSESLAQVLEKSQMDVVDDATLIFCSIIEGKNTENYIAQKSFKSYSVKNFWGQTWKQVLVQFFKK